MASDNPESLEKKIGGEGFVEIQARATTEEVKGVLDIIPEIKKKEIVSVENSIVTVKVESAAGQDVREDLFFAFAGRGVPLLELTRTKTTLEEVFLELTQGNAAESEEQMYDSDI